MGTVSTALPAGFTVDQDPDTPQVGASALPAGFTVEPNEDPTPPAPPTAAPESWLQKVGDLVGIDSLSTPQAPASDTSPAARFERNTTIGPNSDIGQWLGNEIKGVVAAPVNATAALFGDKPPISTTPSPGAQRIQQKISGVRSAANNLIPTPTVQNPTATTAAIEGAENPAPGSVGAKISEKAQDIGTIAMAAMPFAGAFRAGELEAELPAVIPSAEENLAAQIANSPQSQGAALATPSLDGVSPELRQAVASTPNINLDALNRQIDAETLPLPDGTDPLRLRAGQATRDDQQISDEKNMRADPDTQGLLSGSITDQNEKLGLSMGTIRQQAVPDIVQRSNAENGQAAIDAIKAQDNAALTDIRGKYQALADQNAGAMPIDAGAALGTINANLSKGFLTKTAAQNPVVSEVLDNLSSGNPMSFEQFENARTNLAAVQRSGGPPAAAAGIVRGALESLPLPGDAQNLKAMADAARQAAKARFTTIDQNPAYSAVVDDNVPRDPNGLHVVGAPSPLADNFMDRYFLGNGQTASRAYVARIKGVMQNNPDFSPSIEAASLNKLRSAANLDQYDNGNFASASFRNAQTAMAPKADVLMSPQTADNIDHLRRVSDDVSYEGKAANTNRSNTAVTLQRYGAQYPSTPGVAGTLADYATDMAAAHTGPIGYAAKRIGSVLWKNAQDAKAIGATRTAKLKFAQDATAPGAGIDMGTATAAPAIARASGGKVDHDALVNQLISKWKAAKKASDKTTEPLLRFPDAAITRALNVAQTHL